MRIRNCLRIGAFVCFAIALFPVSGAEDQSPHTGIWKWNFTMPDGSEISPRVWIKEEKGTLQGTARFRPGSEMAVTNLVARGEDLAFDVVRERGGVRTVTRYRGKVNGDQLKGTITSDWAGEEQSFDWQAKRFSGVEGTWRWPLSFGGFRGNATVVLKQDGEKLSGKLPSRRGADQDVKNGRFKDGTISFETERERNGEKFVSYYSGRLSGDRIIGTIRSQFGDTPRTNDWEAVRID